MRKQQRNNRTPTDRKMSRHICHYCRVKRFEDRMKMVFSHPVLTGNKPIWACTHIGYLESKCIPETIKTLTMYQETGLLQVVQVNQVSETKKK